MYLKKKDHAEADPFFQLFIVSNFSYFAGSGVLVIAVVCCEAQGLFQKTIHNLCGR